MARPDPSAPLADAGLDDLFEAGEDVSGGARARRPVLLRATLIKHDLPDSTAQMVQAVIILVAVYIARERRTR